MQSKIEQQVMASVGVIYVTRRLLSRQALEIYALALPLADELVLTEIDADLDGDIFFPTWDRRRYTCTSRDPRIGYSFVTYRKTAEA